MREKGVALPTCSVNRFEEIGGIAMDITLIPGIMRRHSWGNGARLMEIWFSRQPNSVPERGTPETSTIRMDSWALTFSRCSQVYQQMVSRRIWCSEESKRHIGRWLQGQRLLGSRQRVTFGNLSRPVPQLDRDAICQESVGGLLDPLDDMYAALGRFTIRAVVGGAVVPLQLPAQVQVPVRIPGATMSGSTRPSGTVPQYSVEIEQVGFYIFDTYDFNGDQPLGFWSTSSVSRLPATGYEYVSNETFRTWRSQHGRGGDFQVFSDLKVIRRSPPDSFILPSYI
jgi:hypothetical protein